MPRRIQDIDEAIARLQAERAEAIEVQSKNVGEAALNLWPDMPQAKPEIRKYLKAIDTVVRAHKSEFAEAYSGIPVQTRHPSAINGNNSSGDGKPVLDGSAIGSNDSNNTAARSPYNT